MVTQLKLIQTVEVLLPSVQHFTSFYVQINQ